MYIHFNDRLNRSTAELFKGIGHAITGRNRPSVPLLRREIHPGIFDDPDLDAAVQVLFRASDRRAGAVTLGQNIVGEEFGAAVGQGLGDFRRTLFRECMELRRRRLLFRREAGDHETSFLKIVMLERLGEARRILVALGVAHDPCRRVLIAVRGVLDQVVLGELESFGHASAGLLDGSALLATALGEVGVEFGTVVLDHRTTVLASGAAHPERDVEGPCQQIVKCDLTVFFNDDF